MDNVKFATADEAKAYIETAIEAGNVVKAEDYDVESIYLATFGFDGKTQLFHLTIGEDGFWSTVAQYEK